MMKLYVDANDTCFAQANKKRKREDEKVLVYTRPEDQFFHKLCKWSFQWKVQDSEGENPCSTIALPPELHVFSLFKCYHVVPKPSQEDPCSDTRLLVSHLAQIKMTSMNSGRCVFAC